MEKFIDLMLSNYLVTFIISGITGITAYVFGGKRKQKLESDKTKTSIESSMTDNVIKNLNVYQRMFEDLAEQIKVLSAKVKSLELQNEELKNLYEESKSKECL